jgi:hypothetical protein
MLFPNYRLVELMRTKVILAESSAWADLEE